MTLTGQLLLGAIILVPIISALIFSIVMFRRHRRGRRSPLTGNLLRGPGESLRAEIERASAKLDNALLSLFGTCVPPLLLVAFLSQMQNNKVLLWQLATVYLFYLALVVWWTLRIHRLLQHRTNLVLGLDAELAVGQELNQLMLQGCRVYHDFPAENFNIDHVVVGPKGIFAVETKGRAKPDRGRGSADAKVVYDGQKLIFPGWFQKDPLDQAKRQADWLQKWLGSAVGESVSVKPVLMLPGWFVERANSGDVLVLNPKEIYRLTDKARTSDAVLNPQMIQRIAHQLEQRCRDVEPAAYRKEKPEK